jgi:hypothetical protein
VLIRPVNTVPRPEIENTSSIGIRNALSKASLWQGNVQVSSASASFMMASSPTGPLSPSHGEFMEPWMMGCRHREIVLRAARALHFDQFQQLGVVHHVAENPKTTRCMHAHLAGHNNRMCSRVWGIGPSAAEHTKWRRPRGTGDRVFHIIGVAQAVNVSVICAGRFTNGRC